MKIKNLKDEPIQGLTAPDEINKRVNPDINKSEKISSKKSKQNYSRLTNQTFEEKSSNSNTLCKPEKGPQKKAKLLRIERKRQKLLAQGKSEDEIINLMKKRKQPHVSKSLEDLLDEMGNGPNKLEVLILVKSLLFCKFKAVLFSLFLFNY